MAAASPFGATLVRAPSYDVTEKAGLGKHTGWSSDVGHGDLNNDGWQDIYLACDYGTDRVFLNNGDGTFRDATEKATGWDTKKGMNVDVADYDNDGWLDIYVTNIYRRVHERVQHDVAQQRRRHLHRCLAREACATPFGAGPPSSATSTTTAGRTSSP